MEIAKNGVPIIFTFNCPACSQEWTAKAGEKTVSLTGYHEFGNTTRIFGESRCTSCGTLVHTSVTRREKK